jgi:glyoxylase-like metal-dependent hydrolase (beta-lactamase superfamily II)
MVREANGYRRRWYARALKETSMQKVSIGNVEITALQDAALLMNPKVFMPQHAEQWLRETPELADERGLMQISITSYLVRSAGKTVLVDTGIGPRKREGFPRGNLDLRLMEAGVDPADIDLVVHTHLHLDHVGWNTVDDEGGQCRVFFPKARFVVQQAEWDHWMQPRYVEGGGQPQLVDCVKPLEEAGRVDLVSGEEPLDEHLTFIPSSGHTPGHVAIGITSGGERGMIIGDASHHPIQLDHPDWSPAFDTDPVQSAKTRDRLFDEAAADGRTFIAGHWAYPGLGRVVRVENRRTFRAL